MESVVADVFLQAFGGTGTVGQIAQDDGDDAGGVVDDFGVVFEIAVLTGMEAVVVTGLEEFGPHTHKLLAGCAEDVVALEKPLFHERQREVVVEEYLHLVVLQKLMAQVGGIGDVEPECLAMIVDGVGFRQLDVEAVVGGNDVVERLKLRLVLTTEKQQGKKVKG